MNERFNMNVLKFTPPPLLGPNGFPFRVVILEAPYDTLLTDPTAHQLFPALLALKIDGYQAAYPYGVLPMETADFVANHIVLCEDAGDRLIPHMAFKSVTIDRCHLHHLRFPAFNLLEECETAVDRQLYAEAIQNILNEAEAKKQTIAYNGSWTVTKEFRAMRKQLNFWEVTMALITQYYRSYEIHQIIAAASAKFKVDEGKVVMGFSYFEEKENRLPTVKLIPYGEEEFYFMHLKNFTPHMDELCARPVIQNLWDNRMIIADARSANKKAA
jgi:hypothetical protein